MAEQFIDKTFMIFRHGKALPQGQNYGSSVLTAELLPEGRPPIERMAEAMARSKLHSDANFTSPVLRCRQTVEIIENKTHKIFVPDSRLDEFHDETIQGFIDRIWSFAEEIKTVPATSILICTHGACIAALRHIILHGKFSEAQIDDYTSTGQMLTIEKGREKITDFNRALQ